MLPGLEMVADKDRVEADRLRQARELQQLARPELLGRRLVSEFQQRLLLSKWRLTTERGDHGRAISCLPGESRDPSRPWIPACAGMTRWPGGKGSPCLRGATFSLTPSTAHLRGSAAY